MKNKFLLLIAALFLFACTPFSILQTATPQIQSSSTTLPTNTLHPVAAQTSTKTKMSTPTSIPTPPLSGRIIFSSRRDGNLEIYIMNADGSGLTRLTNTGENELGPVGSPDGTFIAFSADYEGDENIYRIQSDGSSLTRLTTSPANDFNPEWSPDGGWLLFSNAGNIIEGYEGPPPEIYIMDKNGGGQRRLTNNTTSDNCPSWSPDMSQITFISYRYDFIGHHIEIMDSDGTDLRTLIELPEYIYACPVWSPDGQQLVFSSMDSRQEYGTLWLMSPDGTNLQELPFFDKPALFQAVRWSPDGKWLVFSANIGSGYDIYRATLDGVVVNLTPDSSEDDESPSWIP